MSAGIMTRFLTAEWRHLAMLNYEIAPAILSPLVPAGTELDSWNGKTYVSLVGFLFLNTRVLGMPIPFHRNFEEVNLRFYVRRKDGAEWKRGVVFIKEIVPRFAIAAVARILYNEKYISMRMHHEIDLRDDGPVLAAYLWKFRGSWNHLRLERNTPWRPLIPGSEEEFITEHYWGYTSQRNGGTVEYRVEHPRWNVCSASHVSVDCDVPALYGPQFKEAMDSKPLSAFLAQGSTVTVYSGKRIT